MVDARWRQQTKLLYSPSTYTGYKCVKLGDISWEITNSRITHFCWCGCGTSSTIVAGCGLVGPKMAA
ncbi:hypothetical protein MTP99_002512 [Tenebrio molitor]|nr:hypothetical protein MTP99_002512 [Tenebrio molitor]